LELLADGLVLVGDQVGQGLDDADLGTPRLPDARELDADDTTAEHGDLLGDEVELESLLRRDDSSADLEAGQRTGVRPGGQDHVLAGDPGAGNLDGGRGNELALTLDDGDA